MPNGSGNERKATNNSIESTKLHCIPCVHSYCLESTHAQRRLFCDNPRLVIRAGCHRSWSEERDGRDELGIQTLSNLFTVKPIARLEAITTRFSLLPLQAAQEATTMTVLRIRCGPKPPKRWTWRTSRATPPRSLILNS